ncbi:MULTISPECIES: SusC/RagA family TonB-linked outer membrane protein [unclassified Butyricimonas]|uniref:SusC/RagA family TonB-linked outer membrane protein n=1 Tax=unclassified Butyricimonas TaxID=2637652 RepID=UPI000C06916D|nr:MULTISPECIES: SusC/RagA family TonB-linked outer membrane protein [unclassified Butyricimonas]
MKKKRESSFLGRRKMQITFLKMRVTVLLLLMSVLQSMAQTAKYDISMSGGKLENVFKLIEQKGEFTFLYSIEDVEHVASININVKQADLKDVLDICLANTKLTYEINGHLIVIRVRDEKPEDKMIVIKGIVKDKKGEPLPGVTVREKGTTIGVATGIKGEFTFTTTKRDSVTLIFSFVGMKMKLVTWKGEKELKVVMEEDAQEMEEVVVTGYQRVKKSNMAGSVSTIKAEDLVLNGTQSLEQALQGKLPGVVIQNQDGLVGTRQKVRVRGTSTLLGSQDPVWVVDGIIQEDPLPFKATDLSTYNTSPDNIDMIRNFVGSAISWLNPSDIKDVTVLKDASATAIYGVKAANGVIVITTKRGEKGRMSISYSGNFSIGSKVTYDKLNLMNSKERIDVSREMYERGLVGSSSSLANVGYQALLQQYLQEKISYNEFNTGVKKLEVINTDWFDLLYENPFSYSNNISVSGGSDKTTYYASFGITNNNGTAKGNDSESYQGSINVNTVFWDKLQFSARVAGSVSKTNGFHNSISPYSYASTTSRVLPAFEENGELAYYINRDGYKYNVLNELAESGNGNTSNSLNVNIGLNWEIIKGLKYEMALGYNYSSTHGESWITEMTHFIAKIRGYEFGMYGPNDDKYQLSRLPHGGQLNMSDSRSENYTWRNQFSYVKNFGRHLLTATVGQEVNSTKYDGFTGTYYGYLPKRGQTIKNPPLTTQNVGSISENTLYAQPTTSIIDNKSNKLSFYGAFTYTFDERYVFNASVRSDASNRFGQDKDARYLPVWSFGLRWNMGREHFLEGQDFLNEFSFRLTYGYQGNASEAASPDLIARIPSGAGISGATGEYYMEIKSLPNPKLKWEKTATVNAGADFVFWKNKINGSFEYYYKKTTDAIINKEVPFENGVLSMPMNGGSLENYGWELSFSFAPVRTKNFIWTMGLNTSKNYNKVTSKLESNENWTQAVAGNVNKKGYPVSGFWAFEFVGLDPKNGVPLYNLPDVDTPEARTDATVYMKYMGKLDPDFTAGLNMGFRFKDLTLSSSFYLSVGGKKFLATMFDDDIINSTPYEYNNLPKDLVDRWRKPGDEEHTNIPALPEYKKTNASTNLPSGSTYSYRLYNYTDIRVVNASFLRCNNISLSYNLSKGWIKKFAQNVGFSFSVSNPFMIVSKDFKGKDPEVATGSQPLSQNYTFSLNLSF